MRITVKSNSKIEASRPFSKLASKFRYNKRNVRRLPKGGSTTDIFQRVINDPDAKLGKVDKNGNHDIMYRVKNIGWFNPSTGEGYIDNLVYDKLYDKANPSDKWKDDDIIMANEDIEAATDLTTVDSLRRAIEATLDEDTCEAVVQYAYSEDGAFEDEIFFDDKTFFDMYSDVDPRDFVDAFYDGEDLDGNEDHADPSCKYFRYVDTVIDSTDNPGEYYYDNLFDDIVDYILNHLDNTVYPVDIQALIDEYNMSNSLKE